LTSSHGWPHAELDGGKFDPEPVQCHANKTPNNIEINCAVSLSGCIKPSNHIEHLQNSRLWFQLKVREEGMETRIVTRDSWDQTINGTHMIGSPEEAGSLPQQNCSLSAFTVTCSGDEPCLFHASACYWPQRSNNSVFCLLRILVLELHADFCQLQPRSMLPSELFQLRFNTRSIDMQLHRPSLRPHNRKTWM
jgi:hypothetical protein